MFQLPFFLPRAPGPRQKGGVSCTWGTSSYSSTEAIFMPHMSTCQASHITCMIEIQTNAAFVFCKLLLQGFDLHFWSFKLLLFVSLDKKSIDLNPIPHLDELVTFEFAVDCEKDERLTLSWVIWTPCLQHSRRLRGPSVFLKFCWQKSGEECWILQASHVVAIIDHYSPWMDSNLLIVREIFEDSQHRG